MTSHNSESDALALDFPGTQGYEPDGPVGMALNWLKAALACRAFPWDSDQHEIATHTLKDAEAWLAAVLATQAAPKAPAVPETLTDAAALAYRLRHHMGQMPIAGNTLSDVLAFLDRVAAPPAAQQEEQCDGCSKPLSDAFCSSCLLDAPAEWLRKIEADGYRTDDERHAASFLLKIANRKAGGGTTP